MTRASAAHPAERASIKNERRRTIDIDPELVAFLRRHKEAQFARGFARETNYVFCTRTGEPLHYRNLGKAFAWAVERAGIKRRVRFHSLRHRYASVLISGGCDGPYVAQQLGDTVATVYNVYAHLFNARSQTEKGLAAIRAARES